jgi:hypothetical protein
MYAVGKAISVDEESPPVVIYLLEMLFSYYSYSREVPFSTIKSSSE